MSRLALQLLLLLPGSTAFVVVPTFQRNHHRQGCWMAMPQQQWKDELKSIVAQAEALELQLPLQTNNDTTSMMDTTDTVEQLEDRLEAVLQRAVVPPEGLSWQDFDKACAWIRQLPLPLRLYLWAAVVVKREQQNNSTVVVDSDTIDNHSIVALATNVSQVPNLATALYELHASSTLVRETDGPAIRALLQQSLRSSLSSPELRAKYPVILPTTKTTTTSTTREKDDTMDWVTQLLTDDDKTKSNAKNWFTTTNDDDSEADGNFLVESLLPRVVTRVGDDDMIPTADDARAVAQWLQAENYLVSVTSVEPIAGGHLIRGLWRGGLQVNTTVLDYPNNDNNLQVCILPDYQGNLVEDNNGEPMVLVARRDCAPLFGRGWVTPAVSAAAALTSSAIFCLGAAGGTQPQEVVLTPQTAQLALDLWIPLAVLQAVPTAAGAAVVAWQQMNATVPLLVPAWPLPWMPTVWKMREYPMNRTAVANLALAGPLTGLLSSLAALGLGLQQQQQQSAATTELLDMPLRLIQSSTLGGSWLDATIGVPALYLQDAAMTVPLTPLAAAGYVSLLLAALDLLPLGSTSGGRLTTALLGRPAAAVLGSIVWVTLLCVCVFFADDASAIDILTTAWIVNNLVQSDSEVPCRNELAPVALPQALTALGLFVAAVLVATPTV